MSTQTNWNPTPPNPLPPLPVNPPAKPKAKRRWLVPVLVLVALFMGVGIGSAKPAPDPVTITKEVPVEKIVTKEVPVEVPVTPTECGDFITLAAKVNDINSEVLGLLSSSLTAAGNLDSATIMANNAKLPTQTAKLKALTPEYQTARDTCKASLK